MTTSIYTFIKTGTLNIGENLTVTNFQEVKGNSMEDALLQNPLIPVYAEDGTWGGPTGSGLQDKWNPLAILYVNRNNVEKTWRTFGTIYADLNIVDGLTFNSKLNFQPIALSASFSLPISGLIPDINSLPVEGHL